MDKTKVATELLTAAKLITAWEYVEEPLGLYGLVRRKVKSLSAIRYYLWNIFIPIDESVGKFDWIKERLDEMIGSFERHFLPTENTYVASVRSASGVICGEANTYQQNTSDGMWFFDFGPIPENEFEWLIEKIGDIAHMYRSRFFDKGVPILKGITKMDDRQVAKALVKLAKEMVGAKAQGEVINLWSKVNGLSDCLDAIAVFVGQSSGDLSKDWVKILKDASKKAAVVEKKHRD